jgi:O-antigen/teichoic acid export membrane protein
MKDSNKRIAQNTIFLYIRMIVIMGVTLYTTRVVLNYLGVDDFGIYNIVGGIVALLGFLQSAMINASQRFITFELGKGDNEQLGKTFSMSMTSHISIALLILLLAETAGLWFVNTKLNIADERMTAVNWLYQFSVLTFIINIIQVPYSALIIAHEKMSFYAYVSISDAFLRLAVVLLLPIISFDKLSVYGGLMFLVPLISTTLYKVYCNKFFKVSKYKFKWDKKLYWQLMSFSGWTMLGGIANVGARQGGNILLNIYSGLIANAALGIANQVSAAVSAFASNLLIAFNPQTIKYYATGDKDNMNKMIFRASSYSFYLVLLIAVPFFLNTDLILHIWLKNVPDYTITFCQLMIVYQLIDMIQAPLETSITATGNIKFYQLWLSSLLILNLPVSWYLLNIGWSPYWVLIIRVGLNFISAIIRTVFVKYFVNFPSWNYFTEVICKSLFVTAISYILSLSIKQCFNTGISGFVYTSMISIAITILVIYLIGIHKTERSFINSFLVKLAASVGNSIG